MDSVHAIQTLTIDLITINVYEVNGVQVALPQRLSPDHQCSRSTRTAAPVRRSAASAQCPLSDGPDAFSFESVANVTGEAREVFDQSDSWLERSS